MIFYHRGIPVKEWFEEMAVYLVVNLGDYTVRVNGKSDAAGRR